MLTMPSMMARTMPTSAPFTLRAVAPGVAADQCGSGAEGSSDSPIIVSQLRTGIAKPRPSDRWQARVGGAPYRHADADPEERQRHRAERQDLTGIEVVKPPGAHFVQRGKILERRPPGARERQHQRAVDEVLGRHQRDAPAEVGRAVDGVGEPEPEPKQGRVSSRRYGQTARMVARGAESMWRHAAVRELNGHEPRPRWRGHLLRRVCRSQTRLGNGPEVTGYLEGVDRRIDSYCGR